MSGQTSDPSVFISYAHLDAWDYARRIAFALDVCIGKESVFIDQRIPAGPFPAHLRHELENCDFLIAVMSPRASMADSWCQTELALAIENGKAVVPARVSDYVDVDLVTKREYTFADFQTDFDGGFRKLTEILLKNPMSSWEGLGNILNDIELLQFLAQGKLPGIIAREVAEWILVDRLWSELRDWAVQVYPNQIFVREPRTPKGISTSLAELRPQFAFLNDGIGTYAVNQLLVIVQTYLDGIQGLSDTDHRSNGAVANTVITQSKAFLVGWHSAALRAKKLHEIQNFYFPDVSEKTREYIRLHARRSRYLY